MQKTEGTSPRKLLPFCSGSDSFPKDYCLLTIGKKGVTWLTLGVREPGDQMF